MSSLWNLCSPIWDWPLKRFEHQFCVTELVQSCFSPPRKPQMWFEKWRPFVDIRVWQQELLLIETSIGCQCWWGRIRGLFYHSPPAPPPIFPTTLLIYPFTQLTKDSHYFQTVFVSGATFERIRRHSHVLFQNSKIMAHHCSLLAFLSILWENNLTTLLNA